MTKKIKRGSSTACRWRSSMAGKQWTLASALLLVSAVITGLPDATAAEATKPAPLVIQEQGSFAVGGTVIQNPGIFDPYKPASPAGQTFHGDHAYAFYQIPLGARKLPLVLWHGAGQFSKDMGDHGGRTRGLSEHLSASWLWRLRDRPAAPRRRRAQHGPKHHHADARRATLVRHVQASVFGRTISRAFSSRRTRRRSISSSAR